MVVRSIFSESRTQIMFSLCFYPHTPIGKAWIYRLLFFCVRVCVCVYTVTDFSAEDKASGFKFCMAIQRRRRQEITHFGELCSIRSQKSDESASARATRWPAHHAVVLLHWCGLDRADLGDYGRYLPPVLNVVFLRAVFKIYSCVPF